jgi:transcription elongation factor GreA
MPNYFTKESYAKYTAYVKEVENSLFELQRKMNDAYETGGTWHDNAALDHLTEDVVAANTRFNSANKLLKDVQIIEYPEVVDSVNIGCGVSILLDSQPEKFQIVAYGDSDASNDKILYITPMAEALMGHKIGDEYEAVIAERNRKIKVLDIQPIKK